MNGMATGKIGHWMTAPWLGNVGISFTKLFWNQVGNYINVENQIDNQKF